MPNPLTDEGKAAVGAAVLTYAVVATGAAYWLSSRNSSKPPEVKPETKPETEPEASEGMILRLSTTSRRRQVRF